MIRNRCNILWVDGGIHTKNASRMMQFSLRFWVDTSINQNYYNDSLYKLFLTQNYVV